MGVHLPPGTYIEPLEETLLCQVYASTGVYKEGSAIRIPETAQRQVFFAKVLAVGPGKTVEIRVDDEGKVHRFRLDPPVVKGDDILYMRYHGQEVEIEDGIYLVLRHDDVMAKLHLPAGKANQWLRFAGRDNPELRDALAASRVPE